MSSSEASSGSFSRRSRTSSLAVFIRPTSVGNILHPRCDTRDLNEEWLLVRPPNGSALTRRRASVLCERGNRCGRCRGHSGVGFNALFGGFVLQAKTSRRPFGYGI